uniref:Uncharacterized protein n=1 Tax=Hemiselmis andersenii TaxID=464988 RepID=A0A7S1HCY4_HEMAN
MIDNHNNQFGSSGAMEASMCTSSMSLSKASRKRLASMPTGESENIACCSGTLNFRLSSASGVARLTLCGTLKSRRDERFRGVTWDDVTELLVGVRGTVNCCKPPAPGVGDAMPESRFRRKTVLGEVGTLPIGVWDAKLWSRRFGRTTMLGEEGTLPGVWDAMLASIGVRGTENCCTPLSIWLFSLCL